MKKTIKLQVEQSKLREKLNTILAIEEELTDEQRAELDKLTKRVQAVEVELRAALVADGKAKNALGPAFDGIPPANQNRSRGAGNWKGLSPPLPWRTLLRQPSPIVRLKARPPSFRSIWVSVAIKSRWSCSKFAPQPIPRRPRTASPISQQFVPAVFPGSIAAFLGIAQPSVGAGQSSYHVLSTNLTASVPDAGAGRREHGGRFHFRRSGAQACSGRIWYFAARTSRVLARSLKRLCVRTLGWSFRRSWTRSC